MPRLILDQVHIAEFSMSQRAFHATTLDRLLLDNATMINQLLTPEYVPIGAFATQQECEDFINQCKTLKRFMDIRGDTGVQASEHLSDSETL